MWPLSWWSVFILAFIAATNVECEQLLDTCAGRAESDTTSLIQDSSSLKAIKRYSQKQETVLSSVVSRQPSAPIHSNTTAPKTEPSKESNPNKIFISSASSAIVAASVVGVFLLFALLMCYTSLKSKVDAKAPLLWFFLSSFLAVFCAALLCTTLRDISTWGAPLIKEVHPMYMDLLRLGFFYFIVQFVLIVTKSNAWVLEACGAVGGYMIGFALAEVYGKLLQMQVFSSSWPIVAMSVVTALTCTMLIVLGLFAIRECCQPSGSRLSEVVSSGHWLQWHDVCGEVEVVAAAIGLGSVLCKVITYVILGQIPANGINSLSVTVFDALSLGIVALGILGLVILLCRLQFQHDRFGEHMTQVESFVLHTMGMTAAWCCLTAGQWLFWDGLVADVSGKSADQVSSRLLMAATFTAAIVLVLSLLVTVTGMSGSKGKYLQVMSCSLALLLGLAWEAWFARAALAYGRLVQACLCLALCLLLLTVWGLYVLPHAVHKKWLLDSFAASVEDALKAPGHNVQHRVGSVLHPVSVPQSHSSSYPSYSDTKHSHYVGTVGPTAVGTKMSSAPVISAETRHYSPSSPSRTTYPPGTYPTSSQVNIRR